jgi:MFS family permease
MHIMTEKVKVNTVANAKKAIGFLPWLICGLGALFYSYEYFLRISPSVMSVDLMDHYGIQADGLGILTGFYYFAYVPMQLPVGVLMDKFGPRRLLTVAVLFCVAGSYLFVATDSYAIAAMGRFILGFGSAFAFVGVLKLATIWLPEDRFAMFAGLSAALGTVGAMVGATSLTALTNIVGWRETVYLASSLGLVLCFLIWMFVRDAREGEVYNGEGADGSNHSFRHGLEELLIVLKTKQIWIGGLIGCLIYLPTTVLGEQWIELYLEQANHLSSIDAAFGQTALFLGFTIGAPLMGLVSDRLGSRRKPLFLGSVLSGILLVILLYVPGLSRDMIYALLFFSGLCYSAQAIVFAVGRENAPESASGTAIAVINMIVMLGGMVFQPLAGFLLDAYHGNSALVASHIYSPQAFQFAMAIVPIGVFTAAVLALFLKESERKVSAH